MDRYAWARKSAALDPDADAEQISRLLASHEFPWDITQALGFALFRTYAERTQKRYAGALRARSSVVRHLPPRREPYFARHSPNIRSYPYGYDVRELGTFAPGCPMPHRAATDSTRVHQ